MPRIDQDVHKLHPWLRVIRNGSRTVNAVRSDGSTRVASTESVRSVETAPVYEQMSQLAAAVPRWTEAVVPATGKVQRRGHRKKSNAANTSFVNVYIELFPEPTTTNGQRRKKTNAMQRIRAKIEKAAKSAKSIPTATVPRRNIISATIPVSMLDTLDRDPAIAFVHPADALKLDHPTITGFPSESVSKAVGIAATHGRGKDLIIGIIDVGGFDFAHPDFLKRDGTTRFLAIWDQGGDSRDPPSRFGYGAEILKKNLDAAIRAEKKPGMPQATRIEPQSQHSVSSHGTHVASIAAGKSGVCPQAHIAAVLIDVPHVDSEIERRRSTFADSSRVTHAVEYLLGIAEAEGLPIAINISLGTNGGSHDGASGVSRWLDAYLATPGRAICVAAGNAGQEKALDEDDLGFVMGRIHASGQIAARGLEVELGWTVIGDGIEDMSENELEIWYGPQDRFSVMIKPPGANAWLRVKPGEFVENKRLADGTFVSVYNEMYHPTTGGNYIAVYLSPNLDPEKFRGITPGVWKVRIIGEEVRDGHFDAWIERDDPMEIGTEGGRRLFRFPSFFTERTNVDTHSITSLACGHRVIAVANLDEVREQSHPSSSQGPTRDGRCKPEVAAPGTDIVAANGFAERSAKWVRMTGTSMACPHVTGVVGLMLAANKKLTAAQCLGILQRTARPVVGGSYKWVNDLGFGRINPVAAVEEARDVSARHDISDDDR
jgi:subtilisin family serine protease